MPVPTVPSIRKFAKPVLFATAAVVALMVLFGTTFVVDQGKAGVVARFGKVVDVVDPGLHLKWPLVDDVFEMPTATLSSATAGTTAVSRDLQDVRVSTTLNYRISHAAVKQTFTDFRAERKAWEDAVVGPLMNTAIKTVSARYEAAQIIAQREKVTSEIRTQLEKSLGQRGFVVEAFSLTNAAFSEKFTTAIENKVVAEQDVLTAQQTLRKEQIEAQKRVAVATAEAEATKLRADAEVYALQKQREVLSPQILELRRIEAERAKAENWRPTTIVQGQSGTLLNVPASQ